MSNINAPIVFDVEYTADYGDCIGGPSAVFDAEGDGDPWIEAIEKAERYGENLGWKVKKIEMRTENKK